MAKRQKSERGRKGYRTRRTNVREPRQRFLILCEGEATEPAYFEKFRTPKVVITVQGIGVDPLSIVHEAVNRSRQEDDYDQVWCVFDRDQWEAGQFNQAITTAQRQGIGVAYSNEAFELWFWLHFHFCDVALNRGVLANKLTRAIGMPYRKNLAGMYGRLLVHQQSAIERAERLLALSKDKTPASANPSTTVHLLVQELNKHAQS